MNLRVLYEDNHLIAVYKPSGVLVQGDQTGDPALMDMVKEYLKRTYKKSGNVFLGLLHRLDRPVSGIVLFAKTGKGASRLSEQFRNRSVEKIYHALVAGIPKKSADTLVHFLKKNPKTNVVTAYKKETDGALRAELSYETVQTVGKNALLKIRLHTGRPHQIRVQLAAIGHPIVGDVKYGAQKPLPDRSLALFATSLTFVTATGGEQKTVSVPVPLEWKKQNI